MNSKKKLSKKRVQVLLRIVEWAQKKKRKVESLSGLEMRHAARYYR